MKKLLLVTDTWYPQVNGVVTTFANLIPRLESRDISVVVIQPALFFSIPMPGYPEIRLSLFSRRKIRSTIAEEKPDFIHIATEGPLGWAARSICIKQRLAFSTTFATRFDLYAAHRLGVLQSLTGHFLIRFHKKSTRVFVATNALKEYLSSLAISQGVVSPLGVDTHLFMRRDIVKSSRLQAPVFAYFGRVATEKGVEEFLSCALPGTKIVIGDGPERAALEKKFPTVCFVGMFKGQELVDWLSQIDVCVFPSKTDTFGLTIIESLACGIPVAAHSVMGPRDILTDGVDGVLGEDLSAAAIQCLALDRTQCRKKAEQYSWDKAARAFIQNLVPVRDAALEVRYTNVYEAIS